METYKALIVEDVKDTADYILSRIRKLCPEIKEIAMAHTLQDAQNQLINNDFSIVFMDIQMPEGTSFDLLKQLTNESNIDFEIIFITGESAKEYTLKAIKYSAIDFLYKPLDDSELVLAVRKAIDKLSHKNYNKQVEILLEHIASRDTPTSSKIAFHLRNGIVELIDIPQIIYLQADSVVTYVYLTNDRKLTANRNLGFYKELLISDFNFKQISNSLLVNNDFIKQYNHHELTLTLTDGSHLYASKRFGKILKDELSENPNTTGIKKLLRFWKND
jgi:two-component system LytT family response regulator